MIRTFLEDTSSAYASLVMVRTFSSGTKNLVVRIERYSHSENEILRGVCPERSRRAQDDIKAGDILSVVRRDDIVPEGRNPFDVSNSAYHHTDSPRVRPTRNDTT